MPGQSYDEALKAALDQLRTQCDNLESGIECFLADGGSDQASVARIGLERYLQGAAKKLVITATDLRSRSLQAKTAPNLMCDLNDLIPRLEEVQREIDGRLTPD